MKHLIKPLLTIALALVPFATVSGQVRDLGLHDFEGDAWNPVAEKCVVCHTPHNADVTITDAPLWNHETTAAAFTTYNSSTFDGNGGAAAGQPDGISKLCLSCHDGSVALENFGGTTTGTNTIDLVNATAFLDIDISDDHPVSFTYNAALSVTDIELEDPETATSGLGGTIEADMLFGTAGSATLECASCHDVHAGDVTKFLMKDNTSSALCRTCHIK
jgi:predicted CXXCH cytochrome family protein